MILGSCMSLQLGAAVAMPLLAQFGAGLTTAVRLLFASLLLLLWHRPRLVGWTRPGWKAVLMFGIAMAGMNGFFYAAIARIPLGIAVTIEFAGPLLLAALLSRQRRDLGCVIAAAGAIVVLGVADVGPSLDLDPVGVCYALVAAGFWALYILAGKKVTAVQPGQGSLAMGMFVSAMVVAPFGIGAAGDLAAEAAALLPLLGVAVLSSLVPYSLEFAALRRLSSHGFGVLLCLEPLVAGAAGWLLLGQALSLLQVLAMLVVVGAAITVTLGSAPDGGNRHRSNSHPSDESMSPGDRDTSQGDRPNLLVT
jgi:inner membrane transporter RhtA